MINEDEVLEIKPNIMGTGSTIIAKNHAINPNGNPVPETKVIIVAETVKQFFDQLNPKT